MTRSNLWASPCSTLSVIALLTLAAGSCNNNTPSDDDDTTPTPTPTPDVGGAPGCGDGVAEPGEFCFEPILIPDIERRASVAGSFTSPDANQLALVHSISANSVFYLISVDTQAVSYELTTELTNGISAHRLIAADFDGDGDNDVLETTYANVFGMFWNNDGELAGLELVDLNLAGDGHAIPLDIDGDNVPEVLKASQLYGEVGGAAELFAWSNDEWTPSGQSIEIPGCGSIGNSGGVMAFGVDLDDDGSDDLVLAGDPVYAGEELGCEENTALHELRVHFGDPDTGLLGAAVTVLPNQKLQGVRVGDIDGDKNLDILALPYPDGDLLLIRGLGDRSFTPAKTLSVSIGGATAEMPMVGDFDGDGIDELAVPVGDSIEIHDSAAEQLITAVLQIRADSLDSVGDMNGDSVEDFVGTDTQQSAHNTIIFLSNP